MKLISSLSVFLFSILLGVSIYAANLVRQKDSSHLLYVKSFGKLTGFPVFQEDHHLKDLFNRMDRGALCATTTLANVLGFQKQWHSPTFSKLNLAADPLKEDYSHEVRILFDRCFADKELGAATADIVKCAEDIYISSGYTNSLVKVIGPSHVISRPTQKEEIRPVTVDDIKTNIQKGYGVLMSQDVDTNTMIRKWNGFVTTATLSGLSATMIPKFVGAIVCF
jgi:hypothetical protein